MIRGKDLNGYYNQNPYGGYGGPVPPYSQNNYFNQIAAAKLAAKQERRAIRRLGNIIGGCLIAFLLVQFAASLFLGMFPSVYELYTTSSVFQNSFGVIAIELIAVVMPFGLMAYFNKNEYGESGPVPGAKIKPLDLLLWVGFGLLLSNAANYLVSLMSVFFEALGFELTSGESLPPANALDCVLLFVSTAVVPAVCEEFAMRCCSLGILQKYGKGFAVFCVSVVFGLMHGNLVQFIFAALLGFGLGYVTVLTGSIWPAVLIHGLSNGRSVIADISAYLWGQEVSDGISVAVFYLLVVFGVISTVILAVKHKLTLRLDSGVAAPYSNTAIKKAGAFFSSPVMIIALIYFAANVISSIKLS